MPSRFWALIEQSRRDPDECWSWAGSRNPAGYALYSNPAIHGTRYAHRQLWMAIRGPIPAGMEIDHVCRNRACMNPAHHECVTVAVNRQRRQYIRTPTCPAGHERTPETTMTTGGCRICHRARLREWHHRNRDRENAKRRARRLVAS